MASPTILILHASVGHGHKTAALALQESFARKGVHAVVEDLLDYALPVFKAIYADSYLELSEKAPDFMSMIYRLTDRSDSEFRKEMISIISRIGVPKFRGFENTAPPDAVIHTHHLGMDLLKNTVARLETPIKSYCVVTDYTASSLWAHKEIARYYVADQLVSDILQQRGIEAERIRVLGIPVRGEISTPKDRAAVLAKLGVEKTPVVSLLGAGLREHKVKAALERVIRGGFCGTLLIVCGRNDDLMEALEGLETPDRVDIIRYGHIDYMDDIIVASDIVISKAGGLTVSEVLARGKPLIVFNGIRGQEEWNADYVCAKGVGIQVHVPDMISYAISSLLSDPDRMESIRISASRAGKPHAAEHIAEDILNDLA